MKVSDGVSLSAAGLRTMYLAGTKGDDTIAQGDGHDTILSSSGYDTLKLSGAALKADNLFFTRVVTADADDVVLHFFGVDDTLTSMMRSRNAPNYKIITELRFSCEGMAHPKSVLFHANDFVLYNSTTGALYYDADGSGAGAAVQFAILPVGLALVSGNFIVV